MTIKKIIRRYSKKIKRVTVRLANYRFKGKHRGNEGVYFILDNKHLQKHPGLMDRMKAIVGMYYIAKVSGMDFYLIHDVSFKMSRYLRPNKVKWECEKSEVSNSIFDTKILVYDPYAPIPLLKSTGDQLHCYEYIGRNILEQNQIENWEGEWKKCYDELFVPSDYLMALIQKNKPAERYVGIHLRFVNALGNFEDATVNSSLPEAEKESLIQQCIQAIQAIQSKVDYPVVVFSDSSLFLQRVNEIGIQTLGDKDIGHVSFSTDMNSIDKTFVDAYVLAEAESVYAIQGHSLYASAFSKYAAIIGGKPYYVHNIE